MIWIAAIRAVPDQGKGLPLVIRPLMPPRMGRPTWIAVRSPLPIVRGSSVVSVDSPSVTTPTQARLARVAVMSGRRAIMVGKRKWLIVVPLFVYGELPCAPSVPPSHMSEVLLKRGREQPGPARRLSTCSLLVLRVNSALSTAVRSAAPSTSSARLQGRRFAADQELPISGLQPRPPSTAPMRASAMAGKYSLGGSRLPHPAEAKRRPRPRGRRLSVRRSTRIHLAPGRWCRAPQVVRFSSFIFPIHCVCLESSRAEGRNSRGRANI